MTWTITKAFLSCGWSAFTYLFGVPDEKAGFWANHCGFTDPVPALIDAWTRVAADPSFHNLKNLLVEWVRADPQRAAKVLALAGCLLGIAGLLLGGLVGGLLIWVF